MSHTAQITSHRKPRRPSASAMALRAGVAGGVLSTIAVAGSAGTANAEPVTETIEMPVLSPTAGLALAVEESVQSQQQIAFEQDAQAREDSAADRAAKTAKKAKAEAVRLAEAEKKAEEKREREEAAAARAAEQERAARAAERTDLSTARTASAPSSGVTGGTTGGSQSQAPSTSAPASGSVATVINFLKAQLGDAYVMGATGPNSWDCSSLVQAAFRQVGVDLPRISQEQSTAGTPVALSNLQVGDILYWGNAGSAYHTGVYIGGGQYLDAANPAKGVVIQDLSGYPATGAVRVL
ncbi:C40 family peptidase [Streptomyces clavuligerus]|uniref:C40 family peptidase n=1 Tax=Streptomyces clavuligerus TaxID=1901 RepID=UPI000AAAD1E6|nr:C40 family peptidase [Streptomyces clavuligerus]QPL63331.1 C40 family peptidase [Streptomyces clavuligerus]QPL69357.1 C40 family peptidase [Streptomyces clavuligerus]QPL75441.1 C40 family peptidase [Streptomyces clavuligerus]QPL81465.1 C40 family peptidase [Streptomyces clavuligerus]QPL88693.1 C40 family peptidase [Streptomyces clavuligerus]